MKLFGAIILLFKQYFVEIHSVKVSLIYFNSKKYFSIFEKSNLCLLNTKPLYALIYSRSLEFEGGFSVLH